MRAHRARRARARRRRRCAPASRSRASSTPRPGVRSCSSGGRRRGDDRGQPPAGGDRPAAERRRARSRAGRHRVRPRAASGRQGGCGPPTGASTRSATSRGGAAIHPRRQLPRRPGDPERAVPAAGRGRRRTSIPRVTFTDPELAHVGLTEAEAGAGAARSGCCAGRTTRTTAPRPSARPSATSRS